MKYDFDKIINRKNTFSYKYDVADNILPMWVADMDFKTAPKIIKQLEKRVEHGIFGYSIVPQAWYESYINWWDRRHHFKMEKEWLIFVSGVVAAISSVVRRLTLPAEKVLIQTPVYNIFFNSIINNGRYVAENPLIYDGNSYQIDFKDLEEKLKDPQVRLFILCNPHNPVGKIYSKDELDKVGQLCKKYNVVVLSDEIHCDITRKNYEYVPFASVSKTNLENSITCLSASKAFNLAGMQSAAVCIPNNDLYLRVNRGLNNDEIAEPNAFAIISTITAFNECEDWLEQLNAYIDNNYRIVNEYLLKNIPQIKCVKSYATYLLWLDCSSLKIDANKLQDFIKKETGLYLCSGLEYGNPGQYFLRMNIACSKKTLLDGLNRLNKAIKKINVCI